jgi:3-methyladenine DNA glycosylase/8-oxoguanine DNA glycosylase
MLPPSPDALKARTSYDFRAMDVGMRRAQAIAFASRRAERLEEATDMPRDAAERRIAAFRGIGPWTCARVMSVALGDADAVPVGDYNLPHLVVHAFTGRPRGDDAQMLELLAPYAGHRGRVIRLLHAAGIAAPRFGHRHRIRQS